MRSTIISLTFLFVTAAPAAMADAYKWTDEKGQTHYTQSPPPGVEAELITATGATAATPAPPKPAAPAEPAPAQETEEIKKQLAAEKERMKVNCEVAQHNVKVLSVAGTRPFKDEKGNIVRLDEDQRKTQLDESQKQVEAFCEPPAKPD